MHAEIFKVCLDYWNKFVPDVFTSVTQAAGFMTSVGLLAAPSNGMLCCGHCMQFASATLLKEI
jgi:hypothetical protein